MDDPAGGRKSVTVGPLHQLSADTEPAHRTGPDRSHVQFQREAPGMNAITTRSKPPVREGGPNPGQNRPGYAGGDGGNDAITREFFYE